MKDYNRDCLSMVRPTLGSSTAEGKARQNCFALLFCSWD